MVYVFVIVVYVYERGGLFNFLSRNTIAEPIRKVLMVMVSIKTVWGFFCLNLEEKLFEGWRALSLLELADGYGISTGTY